MYDDLERGHGSAKSLFEQAKEEGTVITPEETQKWKLSFCKSKLDT